MNKIKCVVIGDSGSGKTWLISSFMTGTVSESEVPTIFDNQAKTLEREDNLEISIWDTAGDKKYTKLRRLSYKNADVFILCYSVDSLESFRSIPFWVNEIKSLNVPILLVANKIDMKENEGVAEKLGNMCGEQTAKEYGMKGFVECSASENKNVNFVFERAANVALGEAFEEPKEPSLIKKIFWCCC